MTGSSFHFLLINLLCPVVFACFTQATPTDVDDEVYYQVTENDGFSELVKHPCDRVCESGESMKCKYSFHIELYNSLGKACYDCPRTLSDCFRPHCIPGDGVERGLSVVNRRMPGVPVVVCEGDQVVVDVENSLGGETTSLHFHGEHFRGNQYMDGTPYVTQCPILPEARFVYSFPAKTTGTMFYHSHTAFQRGNGFFGPYIVRQVPGQDPNAHLYDYDLTEHVMVAQEWFHTENREAFILHHWDTGKNKADGVLVNGFGRTVGQSRTPLATFHVTSGKRYRFRLISPGFTLCPIQFSVDDHELTVIASDTAPVDPYKVRTIIVQEGERFDFVLDANQKADVFLMRFTGLFDCAALKVHTAAILVYDNVATKLEAANLGLDSFNVTYQDFLDTPKPIVNPLNYAPYGPEASNDSDMIPVSQLTHPASSSTKDKECKACKHEVPDKTFYLAFDLLGKDNPSYHHEELYSYDDVEGQNKMRSPQINNITLKVPPSTLLTQGQDVKFCNEQALSESKDCDGEDWCECPHVLEVDLGDVVEIFLIDEGYAFDVSHPFHLHGYSFNVVAMERHAANASHIGPSAGRGNFISKDEVIMMNEEGKIKRNLVNPPLKDNVSVPDAGFTVIRFLADNLGYWLMHCHMSWHNHLGMGVIIKVGDVHNTIQPPPKGFPTCGNFVGCQDPFSK